MFEKIGSATTEAAEVLADCCSTALHGVQDYNSKLVEFTEENTKSTLELLKNVATVKSPSEFVDEVTAEHARRRLETMAEQSKLLAELAQRVTLKTTEPIKKALPTRSGRPPE